MFEDIPVDVGVVYEGERIRGKEMQFEFGGPNIEQKFELVQARDMKEITDGKVIIDGPDLKDLEEGKSYPIGILVEAAGKEIEKDLEAVLERRIHEFINFVEGFMHLNQRYDIWLRLSKGSYKKGFNTLEYLGKVLIRLFKSEFPIIEKIQVTFITNPKKVSEWYKKALDIYEARDARARGMKDEDVEEFYGCVLCQSFAPSHVCIISPNRISLCGAINWFDARAAARVDPKGPNFMVPKGELLDDVHGEYSGVNEIAKQRSLGEVERVWMYSMFGHPHTSCGCFEAIAFYIPEVDGAGVVDRGYEGTAVNGLAFSTMANQTGGGKQVEGFNGIAIEYMRSPKFLQADGGWNRVVWLPSNVKEKVMDAIPAELKDKIATEKDVASTAELREWLKEKGHPIVKQWPAEVVAEAGAPAEVTYEGAPTEYMVPQLTMPATMAAAPGGVPVALLQGVLQLPEGIPGATPGEGFQLIFKNVKIKVEKLIIKREEKGKK
ncbi:MAG: CO dehydrogenase/CO-methylating acetyl-CoA synthase complex subunit beta [Candidatus Jordarchaeum sp.]|uniref:CO dehydrogenase/CO-methylating acetyl-CoA synthase complex subunit beta n=1 Tax=Candidatus Jordarchaeum sp. TaxID=2823881 RepID=UPI0040490343